LPKFKITCPYHKIEEELEPPDSYIDLNGRFGGEVPCGHPWAPGYRAILYIEIIQSKVRYIEIKKPPDYNVNGTLSSPPSVNNSPLFPFSSPLAKGDTGGWI
jgi:hypothetical protein